MDNERFLDVLGEEVTEAAHVDQAFTHYETPAEDYYECQWEYENGMWGV